MDVVLLLTSFAVILAGALLFTNAVEWIGHRLKLGEGAVGSLLAAVGTAMPETLIAIVAIVGTAEGGDQVAIGSIVGAPFLLATLAMGLVGLFAYLYRERRAQGLELKAHRPTLERDLLFFLAFFALSLALAWGAPEALRIPVGIGVMLAYPLYIRRTLRSAGPVQDEDTLDAARLRAPPGAARKPGAAALRAAAAGRPRGDGRRRPSLRRGAAQHRQEPRGRAGCPRPDPGPAGDRAAGEGQQLLLGPRRQGLAGARQHHRRDGLPVDDPGRDRPDLHRLGARAPTPRSRSSSASPGECSPTRPCTAAAASDCRRCSAGSASTRPSS